MFRTPSTLVRVLPPSSDWLVARLSLTFLRIKGPSSNIQFMRNMRSALAVVLSDIPPQPANGAQAESDLYESTRNEHMLQVSRPQSPVRHGRSAWPIAKPSMRSVRSLPPDNEVQPLLHRYFSDTGLLFPYIHAASFYKAYNEFKTSRVRRARRSWMGLLYAILAIATTTSGEDSTSVDQRAADADAFFTRAEELCLSDTMNGAGVETGTKTPPPDVYLLLTSHCLFLSYPTFG